MDVGSWSNCIQLIGLGCFLLLLDNSNVQGFRLTVNLCSSQNNQLFRTFIVHQGYIFVGQQERFHECTSMRAKVNDVVNNINDGNDDNDDIIQSPRMFGGIPRRSTTENTPKKSYSVSKWQPGDTMRTATTAGSNNSYLWNMPHHSTSNGTMKKLSLIVPQKNEDVSPAEASHSSTFQEEQDDESDDEEDDYSLIPTRIPTQDSPFWALGNDFDHFINQCTMQTFLFLLKTCRDPQTLLWLENFAQPAISKSRNRLAMVERQVLPIAGSANSKLLSYHGLAAMNTTAFPHWDSLYRQLLEQPIENYIIESWQPQVPSYELEINPVSLCHRLLSVREQIACEFQRDLTVLAGMGVETIDQYWRQVRQSNGTTTDTTRSPSNEDRIVASATLLFLEWSPETGSDYSPSPLRKGNFDLLVLLATQESIHRILMMKATKADRGQDILLEDENEKDECWIDDMSSGNRQFLSNFYLQRLVTHFTGRQPYGRANQFLQELLQSTPSMLIADPNTTAAKIKATILSPSCLVDPTRIAEQIIEMRSTVAMEWANHAENVPIMHTDLKRIQLNLLMQRKEMEDNSFQ